MKLKSTLALLILFVNISNAQLCPGGGTSFSTSVIFSQSWTAGCITGSSCNGGIEFDNRAACEPTTSMDACAPAPSCTNNAEDGSDVWYSFYALSTTAVINVIQNVSFVATIQAFSGGLTCGTLIEIGCAKAGGPSTGVVLNLAGLTVNQLYYFRIFGSSNAASQRTGTYCFCGSSGLGSTVLPISLSHFIAQVQSRNVLLNWTTASESNNRQFEIERSSDGNNFQRKGIINGSGNSFTLKSYSYTDRNLEAGNYYYRLKQVDFDGKFTYSGIVSVKIKSNALQLIFPVPASDQLIIESSANTLVDLFNSNGQRLKTILLTEGKNNLQVSQWSSGVYWLQSRKDNYIWKFTINR